MFILFKGILWNTSCVVSIEKQINENSDRPHALKMQTQFSEVYETFVDKEKRDLKFNKLCQTVGCDNDRGY